MIPSFRSIPVCLALAFSVSLAHAQPGIPWHTIDGGGGTSSGGVFTLSGTIGQPDASTGHTGGPFTLTGGFWAGAGEGGGCPGDFNQSGAVTVQDIYDFLSDWNSQVAGGPVILRSADFNGLSGITVQDIYDFLAAWNTGCP